MEERSSSSQQSKLTSVRESTTNNRDTVSKIHPARKSSNQN